MVREANAGVSGHCSNAQASIYCKILAGYIARTRPTKIDRNDQGRNPAETTPSRNAPRPKHCLSMASVDFAARLKKI